MHSPLAHARHEGLLETRRFREPPSQARTPKRQKNKVKQNVLYSPHT